jgi:signal transduction histidine kinase
MISSRSRLLLLLLPANTLAAVIGVVTWHRAVHTARMQNVDQLLRDKAVIFVRSIPSDDPSFWPDVDVELETRTHPLVRQVFLPDKTQVRQRPATGETLFLREATYLAAIKTRAHVIETIDGGRLGPLRTATYPKWRWTGDGPVVDFLGQVLLPLHPLHQSMRRDTGIAAGVALVWVALSQAVVAHILRGRSRALARIAETAEELSRTEAPVQRLPTETGEPELAQFARACNTMLERLQRLHSSRQKFIADAAHELRTPLAILLGEVEVALRRERDPARYRSVLESNREDILRLSRLTESLLLLARSDGATAPIQRETVDLSQSARETAEALSSLPDRVAVRVEPSPPCLVSADPHAVRHILTNLIDNAQRHSPPDEIVSITIKHDDDMAQMIVTDQGPGIPAHHLSSVFERFHRVDDSRHHKSGGAGLGLAIVHSLTKDHGGTVSVQSECGRGTTFTVNIPIRQKHDFRPPA